MSHNDAVPTIEQIREEMDASLARLLTLLDSYSEAQMLTPTDAGGWNIRDHVAHLAAWTNGVDALLNRQDRWERMGISPEAVATWDFDVMNAEMVVQHRHLDPSEAREWLIDTPKLVIADLEGMADDDMGLPDGRFVAPFTAQEGRPIYISVLEATGWHYDEHTPWIIAIAQQQA